MIWLLAIPLFAFLGYQGGQPNRAWMRDILIPILLGVALFVKLKFPLIESIVVSVLTIGAANTIRIGYGSYDPEHDDKPSFLASITHDRLGAVIRLIWALIVSVVTTLPYLVINIIHHQYIPIIKVILFIISFSSICFFLVKTRANIYKTDYLKWGVFGILPWLF